jgi:hypothetical protein
MAENLLRDSWADLDQADLRLLLQEQIGRPGQYDGDENVIHLPLAREQRRVSLTYKAQRSSLSNPGWLSTARNGTGFALKSKGLL